MKIYRNGRQSTDCVVHKIIIIIIMVIEVKESYIYGISVIIVELLAYHNLRALH